MDNSRMLNSFVSVTTGLTDVLLSESQIRLTISEKWIIKFWSEEGNTLVILFPLPKWPSIEQNLIKEHPKLVDIPLH